MLLIPPNVSKRVKTTHVTELHGQLCHICNTYVMFEVYYMQYSRYTCNAHVLHI